MNYGGDEVDFENELKLELEKLDQIFLTKVNSENITSPPPSASKNVSYEEVEADIEKEQLHDKLQMLLSRTDDYDKQILELTRINFELKSRNEQLQRENERLLHRISDLEQNQLTNNLAQSTSNSHNNEDFRHMEFKLAETRSKLARSQQAYDDLILAKDSALLELEKERMIRLHIEKERDAYSAAYEQSLLHFEKWATKTKSRFSVSR